VRARRVKRLDPDGPLADNLERIVATRLDELCSFVPKALDPARAKALHDMRIAAKRLRYILEVAAEPCFGPYAQTAIKRAKELQDLLGELHDCDVQLPRVKALQDELRAADALEARARAGDAPDLDPTLASGTPHAPAWRGLETLRIYVEARRSLLFERFLELWRELEREGLRARLQYAITERPEQPAEEADMATAPSPSDNGAAPADAVAWPAETDG
jgi:CHAD domain-containing protein